MAAKEPTKAQPMDLGQPYDAVSRTFHWLVVALVLVQITIALILPSILPKSAEDSIAVWHLANGSTILLTMLLRFAWRLVHPMPPAPTDLPTGLRILARATHWAFYLVLILLPLMGWLAANAYGSTPRLLGLIPLPKLLNPDQAAGETIGGIHKVFAMLLFALIAVHVSGALYHALIKRDGVIRRMLPGRA
ncbi:cytochrome b [Belnapia sp. T18]|uniref:Cytochrome b n=1 Tax=Belnapia arida TaxID=2804533 RepID=A0ABS1UH11_9PROT|nr:cytochrome b [Belnapia arida]MBL6082571.1 cytochrome b [Belnapia arida]